MFPGGAIRRGGNPTRAINQIAQSLYQGDRASGSGTTGVSRMGGAVQVLDYTDRPFWMLKVTGNISGNRYTASEVRCDPTTGGISLVGTGGLVCNAAVPLVEINGVTSVATNTIVSAFKNPTGEAGFVFEYAVSESSASGTTTLSATISTDSTWTDAGNTGALAAGKYHFTADTTATIDLDGTSATGGGKFARGTIVGRFYNSTQAVVIGTESQGLCLGAVVDGVATNYGFGNGSASAVGTVNASDTVKFQVLRRVLTSFGYGTVTINSAYLLNSDAGASQMDWHSF
jgi:hypothetical protein